MKRRRIFEPCGIDEAGDERGASSTSPCVPEVPWETAPRACRRHRCIAPCRYARRFPARGRIGISSFHVGWAAAVDASEVVAPLPFNEVFKGKTLWGVADGELFVESTRAKIVASLWTFVLTYAFDKLIDECNQLDLFLRRPGTLFLSDGAANFRGVCYTIVWGKAGSSRG